jgi:hypothetical protein
VIGAALARTLAAVIAVGFVRSIVAIIVAIKGAVASKCATDK